MDRAEPADPHTASPKPATATTGCKEVHLQTHLVLGCYRPYYPRPSGRGCPTWLECSISSDDQYTTGNTDSHNTAKRTDNHKRSDGISDL
jgi:purine nucleoside permease